MPLWSLRGISHEPGGGSKASPQACSRVTMMARLGACLYKILQLWSTRGTGEVWESPEGRDLPEEGKMWYSTRKQFGSRKGLDGRKQCCFIGLLFWIQGPFHLILYTFISVVSAQLACTSGQNFSCLQLLLEQDSFEINLSHLMKTLPPNTGNLAVFWYSEIFFFLVVLSLCSGKCQTWTVSTGGFVQVNPLLPNSPSVVHSSRITLLDCVCKASAQWPVLTHLQWAMNSYYHGVHPCSSQPVLLIPKSTRAILRLLACSPFSGFMPRSRPVCPAGGSPNRGHLKGGQPELRNLMVWIFIAF